MKISIKRFSPFLLAVCMGALGDLKASKDLFKEVPKLMKRKNNQLEIFVVHRVNIFNILRCLLINSKINMLILLI